MAGERKRTTLSDEEELILRAQRGDVEAFETIVHRYDGKVLSIAVSYVNDADEAKDIYQEVFLRVYKALPKFRFGSKFSTWLHRIAVNACFSHRSRLSRHRHISIEQDMGKEDGHSIFPALSLAPDTVERRALRSEFAGRLEKAMGTLSPKQRLVFTMRHFHGYKLREIASMMGCADGTVKRHLFSATPGGKKTRRTTILNPLFPLRAPRRVPVEKRFEPPIRSTAEAPSSGWKP
ncbi:MAG: RNA polymerase sigma factor [Acidobacteriota bacterium]